MPGFTYLKRADHGALRAAITPYLGPYAAVVRSALASVSPQNDSGLAATTGRLWRRNYNCLAQKVAAKPACAL